MSVGLLFDSTRCIGCGACSAGCKEQNGLPLPIEDAHDRLHLDRRREARRRRTSAGCACTASSPTCVSVCPVGALQRPPRGRWSTTRRCASAAATASWPARSGCRSTSGTAPSRSSASASCAPPGSRRGCRPRAPRCARPARRMFGERDELIARGAGRASRPSPDALRRPHLRPRRGRRHVGPDARRRAVRQARPADRPAAASRCRCSPGRSSRRCPTFVARLAASSSSASTGSPSGGTRCSAVRRRARRRGDRPMTGRGSRARPRDAARFGFWDGGLRDHPGRCSLGVTVLRFTRGLGAVTNLSDQFPWGLWIGFDILCGVGLAAGAFTLTATVHIFNIAPLRADRPPDRAHRLPRLPARHLRPAVRPRAAVAHLARDGLLEPALGDVRGRLVRDALHHGAGARVLADRARAASAATGRGASSTPSTRPWSSSACSSRRCTSRRSARST